MSMTIGEKVREAPGSRREFLERRMQEERERIEEEEEWRREEEKSIIEMEVGKAKLESLFTR